MTLQPLSSEEKKQLDTFDKDFSYHSRIATITTVAAAFVAILSAIVLTCSGLCLILPGINAMQDIILPAMLPSAIALAASIPLMVVSFLQARKKKPIYDAWIDRLETHTSEHLKDTSQEQKIHYIQSLLDPAWHHIYTSQILDSLKKKYTPERKQEETDFQKEMNKSLDEVKKKMMKGK